MTPIPKDTKRAAVKPDKPYEGFHSFSLAAGWWVKKIRGKFHYCGKVADGWGGYSGRDAAMLAVDNSEDAEEGYPKYEEKRQTKTTPGLTV